MRVFHLEAAVERRDQGPGRRRRYRRGVRVRAAARRHRPRVEPRGQQARIHPGDPGPLGAAGRDEQRLVDRRLSADEPSGRLPHSLASVTRRSGEWPQRHRPRMRRLAVTADGGAGAAGARSHAVSGGARRGGGRRVRLRLLRCSERTARCQRGHARQQHNERQRPAIAVVSPGHGLTVGRQALAGVFEASENALDGYQIRPDYLAEEVQSPSGVTIAPWRPSR